MARNSFITGSASTEIWTTRLSDRLRRCARSIANRSIRRARSSIPPRSFTRCVFSKVDEEIEFMQKAADIAAEAHVEAMKAVRPGMKEYEIEALIERIFRAARRVWAILHFNRRRRRKRHRASLHKQRRRTARWRVVTG